MAWTGYIALGTISNGVFTELTNVGYARQPFSFGDPGSGRLAGVGAGFLFPAGTDGDWTFDGYAFFAASTDSSPVLVYPAATAGRKVFAGTQGHVQPAHIAVDLMSFKTAEGVSISPGQVRAITGELSALATALPGVSGVEWNDGGVRAIS